MTESGVQRLRKIALFADLSDSEIKTLDRQCAWRRYRPQEQIIGPESDSRDVFFVTEGRVRIVNYSASGREISYDEVETGGVFGELSAIDGRPRSAVVIAVTETLVAALSPKFFKELLENHPDVGHGIILRLAQIVRQSTARIMDLSTKGAHNRVHAELLRLARQNAGKDNVAVIDPAPIHSDIASRVSTTRETVARVLGELTRKGLISREKNALRVDDVAALQALVDEFQAE